MEAKDTVIPRFSLVQKHGFDIEGQYYETFLKPTLAIQAEISFRAGREAEREFILQNTDRDIRARKEGIREMVEWIDKHRLDILPEGTGGFHNFIVPNKEWQAKRKEWEII